MIDPIPYRNEEVDQRFTQQFYQNSLIKLYREFEQDTHGMGKSGLHTAINSALFSLRINLLHVRAIAHGLDMRTDIRFDEKSGYCFDQLPVQTIRRQEQVSRDLTGTEYG